jgi:hypothetical protein
MVQKIKFNGLIFIIWYMLMSTNAYSQVDITRIPLFLHGIYQVEKVLIYPPVNSWNTKVIGSQYQSTDTTDVTSFLREHYGLTEPLSIVLRDSTIQAYNGSAPLSQEIFGFLQSSVIPYEVDSKPSKPGYFTFHLPINLDDKSSEEILLYFPYTRLTYNHRIEIVNDKGQKKYHQVLIRATHTYRVDFYDHNTFVPLIKVKQ